MYSGSQKYIGFKILYINRNHNPLLPVTSQLVTVGMLTVLQIEDYYSK